MKIRPRASHLCRLIQTADVVAYGLSRLARASIERPDLRELLERIRRNPRHIIAGPAAWTDGGGDLQPWPSLEAVASRMRSGESYRNPG